MFHSSNSSILLLCPLQLVTKEKAAPNNLQTKSQNDFVLLILLIKSVSGIYYAFS